MKPSRSYALAVAVQLLVLAAMVVMRLYTLSTGVPLLLKPVPVDPRDPFRGDYVVLAYALNNLEGVPTAGRPFRPGEGIWLVLKPAGKYWVPAEAGRARPTPASGQVAVKGTVRSAWEDHLRAEFGIESFWVPEGEGRALELRYQDLEVEVRADRFGNLALARVLLGGEPVTWR